MTSPSTAAPARLGLAKITKLAFDGVDLVPLWNELAARVERDPSNAPALLDLSFIAQLRGDPATGATLQSRALVQQPLYRLPSAKGPARLKLLAFAAPVDIGGNTPVEFLLEGSEVELLTLYVAPGLPLPHPIPEHDVALVTIPDGTETRPMLDIVDSLAASWPRPILNPVSQIQSLDRDKLFETLRDIEGLVIPMTARVGRADLADIGLSDVILHDVLEDGAFPLIARPSGSHAGVGLEKLDDAEAVDAYLAARPEDEFFVSRFVDYSGDDGLYRKCRIVFVDGRPYACHMAVCEEWKVWYLNAGMTDSPAKRAEEARFMSRFDQDFAARHAVALSRLAERIGLDYFSIDCAETKDGALLVFEADTAAIVHNMDPAETFPYKGPQMRKVFDAFVAMLYKYAGKKEARAA